MLKCFLHSNAGRSINYLDRVKQFWILPIYSSRDLKIVETLERHASSPAVILLKNQTCVVSKGRVLTMAYPRFSALTALTTMLKRAVLGTPLL
jgi:hypothetical protein